MNRRGKKLRTESVNIICVLETDVISFELEITEVSLESFGLNLCRNWKQHNR